MPVLYRNDGGNKRDYLRVRLQGTLSNRDAWGAVVTVQPEEGGPTMVRELRGGNNFLSQNEAVLHFGLGEGDGAVHEVRVRWPRPNEDGPLQILHDVPRNTVLDIVESP